MGHTVAESTDVALVAEYKEFYVRRQLLGGIIKWWKLVKSDRVKNELHIQTTEDFEKVFINDKEVLLTN